MVKLVFSGARLPVLHHSGEWRKGCVVVVAVESLSCVSLFPDPMDYSSPGSFVRGIVLARIYWSGLPFPSPGDFPNPGIERLSLALAGGFFTAESSGKPQEAAY